MEQFGLGTVEKERWPTVSAEAKESPISALKPDSELHKTVLAYLLDRLRNAENEMAKFYSRWNHNEVRVQAYLNLPDWEKKLEDLNKLGEPPRVVSIVVPYSFAVISTVVTFLLHTFIGRRPILPVGTYKGESVEAARNMETVLQFNADHTRLAQELHTYLQDAQVYGVGILRTRWKTDHRIRTVWKPARTVSVFGRELTLQPEFRAKESRLVFEGNEAYAQDPFMFFPDPRVPMTEVNSRGEYVFWRVYEGRHIVKREEAAGNFRWVDHIDKRLPGGYGTTASSRAFRSEGYGTPGIVRGESSNYIQLDQGSVEIIPRELGLGESEQPEKWMFTLGNQSQIIQAEPLGLDHDMHPVVVTEPYTLGHGFGNLGLADYVGPLQDTMTWLVNSHIDNVRRVLNDMMIVDPSLVEMQDLKRPGPGKVIRLKKAAFGRDVRTVVQQLPITDVTRGHMADMQIFLQIGELLTAASENTMGVQRTGGRKTATEVRTAGENTASRLAAQARLISAQSVVDLAEQWSMNIQQLQSMDFSLVLLGREGIDAPVNISPDMLAGDFHFPVHDGTMPVDRVGLLDVWRQVFMAVQTDPELRQRYNLTKIFEFIAELGGAKNIEAMRVQISPDAGVEQGAQAGNLVPMLQGLKGTGTGAGIEGEPGRRIA